MRSQGLEQLRTAFGNLLQVDRGLYVTVYRGRAGGPKLCPDAAWAGDLAEPSRDREIEECGEQQNADQDRVALDSYVVLDEPHDSNPERDDHHRAEDRLKVAILAPSCRYFAEAGATHLPRIVHSRPIPHLLQPRRGSS